MKQAIRIILQFWSSVKLKTRFMSVVTLLISLIISSFTFWSLTAIQKDSLITDTRFCKDLSLLFASNVLNLVEKNNTKELMSFIEKIYLTTASIKYIQLFKIDGTLELSLPLHINKIYNFFPIDKNIIQTETHDFLFFTPIINNSNVFDDQITDITIPLIKSGKNLGTLHLGINPNPMISSSFKLTRYVSITIFVSLWLMVIIGAIFNALTINESIKELLHGVKSIASGNFNQRINSFFNGELGELIISFNEMSARLNSYEKKNVEQLTSEKTKLETLVSTIADGAILLDTDLRLLFVNQAAARIFNWVNKGFIGTIIFNHLPKHVNEALLPVLNNMIKNHFLDNNVCKTQQISIDLNLNQGGIKTFRLLLTTVLDQRGNVLTGVAIIIQDITKEAQLNEAKNQFISNVSHELRTPLCNISSFLETLLEYNDNLNLKQKIQFLTIANNETKRLTRLVNDVLDLSKLESEYNYRLKPVDLSNLLNNTMSAYQLTAKNQNIYLLAESIESKQLVFANESTILQVLSNLLGNALKFNHRNSMIVIRAYPLNSLIIGNISKLQLNAIRIEVIDQGIGIDKNNQKNVFDRFMRMENNVHTFEGTGLGLSIVKNIIEKHNSQISIYSELGVGTSFWFDLLIAN